MNIRKKSSKIFILFSFFSWRNSSSWSQNVLKWFMEENYNVLFIINKSISEDDEGESSDINKN